MTLLGRPIKMKISIAVPSFNYAGFIRRTLLSIKSQDYTDYEVLICDGGSTDGSLEVINSFVDNDSRFRLVSVSDTGQANGLNKAFLCASGDIYCFLNSDDYYLSRCTFSKVVHAFKTFHNVEILSLGGYFVDENDKYIRRIDYRYHPLDSFANFRNRSAVLQPGTFWKSEISKKYSFNDSLVYVFDQDFFHRVYSEYSWLALSDPVAGYRLHGSNKSLGIKPKRVAELIHIERKFNKRNYIRAPYLYLIYLILVAAQYVLTPKLYKIFSLFVYYLVNSISFLFVYRLPSI